MSKVAAVTNREHVIYGLIAEAFFLHRSLGNDYVVFPQLYIDWNPAAQDAQHVIPDFGIGRYVTMPNSLCFHLQGGAEVKAFAMPWTAVAEGVPSYDEAHLAKVFRVPDFNKFFSPLLSVAYRQAEDQVKSALKCGHLPWNENMVYKWLIFMGPYFRSFDFGPFAQFQANTPAVYTPPPVRVDSEFIPRIPSGFRAHSEHLK
ncbi:hypothetical protein AX14_011503 [Amanita brunnescens Koide BX004]|nr:hypothetical protein AX14_011503 [Amanita brunnescens Koide BX004]